MAIYSLPGSANRIAGSRRGATFQKAGTNFIIRKRAVPVQKRTSTQSRSKSLLGSTSQRWRTLSSGDQSTWKTEAPNYPRTDSLGNMYTFNGSNMQVGSNMNLELTGNSPIASPPAGGVGPAPTAESPLILLGANFANFPFTPHVTPAGTAIRLYIYKAAATEQAQGNPNLYRLVHTYQPGEDSFGNNIITVLRSAVLDLDDFVNGWVLYAFASVDLSTGQLSLIGYGTGLIQP